MNERIARYKKGRWAELKAAAYLLGKGYRIKSWRYKTRHGEIDLIAAKGKTIAFVEVKARDTLDAGIDAVSPKTRARIQDAANHYARHRKLPDHYVWRFDVVVVRKRRLPYHMKDAWRS
jgi:putative endonuclease